MFKTKDQNDRIENEFMKLGIRGTTITSASGDGGSHYSFMP